MNIWKKNIQDKNKKLDDWGNNLLKIIKKSSAKFFINQLKDNIKDITLKKLVYKNEKQPKEEKLDYYFAKWAYINKKIKQNEYANVIQKFCLMNLKNRKIDNNWKKLYSLLKNKNIKDNINDILKLLKYYISMTKLTKTLKGINKKNIFDNIKKHINTETIITILIEKNDKIDKKK